MNITNENKVTIYRYDGQYGPSYSVGLSKKKQDGVYEKGFIPCRFKKGVELDNKTEIYIKSAWLSFNTKDKKTYPFIFINEFTTQDSKIEEGKKILENKEQTDPYKEFANEIEITEEDLPF